MNCPLCKNEKMKKLEKIDKGELSILYKKMLDIDFSYLINEDIHYCECNKCKLRFYDPLITGDENFYNALQKFDWYYMDEKEEYLYAKKYIKSTDKVLEVGSGKGAFAKHLITKYYIGLDFSKNAKKLASENGDNFQNGIKRGDADYYFSIYNHIWGWASWANRWKNYDVELKTMTNIDFLSSLFTNTNTNTKKYWENTFKTVKNNLIDTWDYQWTFTLWNTQQLTILPNVNLIENVGFGADATHTTMDSELANLKAYELNLKNHPEIIERDFEADIFTSKLMFNKRSFLERVINKLKRILYDL